MRADVQIDSMYLRILSELFFSDDASQSAINLPAINGKLGMCDLPAQGENRPRAQHRKVKA